MARMFGTDGVRGKANMELTPELAYKLGRAAAVYFKKKDGQACTTILVEIHDYLVQCMKQL